MPRQSKPLNEIEIRNSRIKKNAYTLFDGEGLQLRVQSSGTRTWLFNYQHPVLKKRQNVKLGNYPAVGLADARKKKLEYQKLLAERIDPIEWLKEQREKEVKQRVDNLQSVTEQWFQVKLASISPRYGQNLRRMFEQHLFPFLGDSPVQNLRAPAVIQVLKPLEARGALETLTRVCQRLNELMTWCVNVGLVESNPLTGIKAAFRSPKTVHMRTIPVAEMPELLQAMSQQHIHPFIRGLFEWQLHTMVRPGEAATARWENINWQQKLWVIPATRMKMSRSHAVPLTEQTLAILETMRPLTGCRDYIFPSVNELNTHAHKESVNNALKRNGFKGRLVSHGLRALASTVLNEHGHDYDVIEAALAHSDPNQVRSAYNRAQYLERRRELMAWWSQFIASYVQSKPRV